MVTFCFKILYLFFYPLVPDYLRTKYDPEIEDAEQRLETMATSIPTDHAQVKQTKCKKSNSNICGTVQNPSNLNS